MPVMAIGGVEIPLAAGPGASQYVWALLNLILVIAGAILAIVVGARACWRKLRNRNKQEQNQEEAERHSKNRMMWLIATIVMGVLGIVIFLLTEDMSKLMVLVDKWTIVNAIILVLGIVSCIFALKRDLSSKPR
jgi:uncharacterized membrane protein